MRAKWPHLVKCLGRSYIAGMSNGNTLNGLAFLKMHGAGNDFVVIDGRHWTGEMTPALARAIGDRNRGVGYDQLAVIADHPETDIGLTFWNADGSTAGACGNATRCVADLVMREGDTSTLTITTAFGLLQAERRDGAVWVNMGHPVTDWQSVPLAAAEETLHLPIEGDPVAVGMGNPHCVFFSDTLQDPAERGPEIERHPLFPEGTNVEFAQVRARDDIRMRVWERGTGITLACGSGACATLVAAHRRGLTDRQARIEVDGGVLQLNWAEDGVWMTGPTALVFEGHFSAAFLEQVG